MNDPHDEFEPVFELERRFLVADPRIAEGADWELITQAYIFSVQGFAVRVRRVQRPVGGILDEGKAWMTGKGPRYGAKREEYDLEVSPLWAEQVIQRSANVVSKRRYHVVTDQTWEVDEFLADNVGLWVAELEGGTDIFKAGLPAWVKRELLNEPRFNNEELAVSPISEWADRADVVV